LEMDDNAVGFFNTAKANGVWIRRGSTSILDTPDCYGTLLLAINQGPREPVTNHYRRFVFTTEVIEEQWGKFYREKLAVSAPDADKNITRDKYLSIIFLA
jgi:hypothetical protein